MVRRGLVPIASPGASNDLRAPSPDVIASPDGSLPMSASGQRTTGPGQAAGSVAFRRSR